MPKLTKEFIESEIQLPVAGQVFYRDDDISGFAVRATPKSKSYILEKRVNGVNRGSPLVSAPKYLSTPPSSKFSS